jgi:hypothetical protein
MWEVLDGEGVIVDLSSGHYHAANGVALDIWLALDAGHDQAAIIGSVVTAKSDAPDDAAAQVGAFIDSLAASGLIVPSATGRAAPADPPAPTPGPWTAPAFESFDDLEDLLLLDPVHDITADGWPNAAPTAT